MLLLLLYIGKLMKFIDSTWKVISEHERLQLTKTEGQVTGKFSRKSQPFDEIIESLIS